MDRIDMHIEVPRLAPEELSGPPDPNVETSARVRERVDRARSLQLQRAGKPNHALTSRDVDTHCFLDAAGRRLMEQAMTRLGLSARAFHRVLKVARTIADLNGAEVAAEAHAGEALGFRGEW